MKGRTAHPVVRYPQERIEAANAIYEAHKHEMQQAAATLAREYRLADRRVLRFAKPFRGGACYQANDGMVVIATYDATPHGLLLHISASYKNRAPTWSDLTLLRDVFFPPDVDVIQVLPRAGEYVNAHAFCHHLFAAPSAWQGGWNV